MLEDLTRLAAEPAAWIALATLIVMEVVLGIDNLVFVSIISNKVPEAQRPTAQRIGLGLALIMRLGLLAAIAWVVSLTAPVFAAFGKSFSWRDLILIGGGLFLVWKATTEIHHNVQPEEGDLLSGGPKPMLGLTAAIVQIFFLNVVFSIDSIITAIGMTNEIPIMVISVVVAVLVMLVAANPLGKVLHNNPTIVMLALGFLLMIGMTLIAEGFGAHVPKGYLYSAMAFSGLVEVLNLLSRRSKRKKLAVASAETTAP